MEYRTFMPTYEYQCPQGHRFDLFQRMSDEPRASCPECGAESQRMISGGAGFLFKGDGFYITDYRSDSYKKQASKETAPVADSSTEKSAPETGKAPQPSPSKTPGDNPSEGS